MLAEVGAGDVPELVVINKADSADPIEIEGLQLAERESVVVSAMTGDGVDKLETEIERLLPRQYREVSVVIPYDRGDLLSRAHDEGEVLTVEHCGNGTELTAKVPLGLAAELDSFAQVNVAQ